ncbi:hypothetical protein [Dietzia maris]|uniref:hypothetical protein n=1 Tax=Dietzia maris TaxID=37915 RepID=UPI0037CB4E6B
MATHEELVQELKEIRRDGLNAYAKGVTNLGKMFNYPPGQLAKIIRGQIKQAELSDGLYYLVGAYGLNEDFDGMDLTHRRKLFCEILDVSLRTLIRREDAAIETLAERLDDIAYRVAHGEPHETDDHFLAFDDLPLPAFEDMMPYAVIPSRRTKPVEYKPDSDLVRAIRATIERIEEKGQQIQELTDSRERDIQALSVLMKRIEELDD